eukprot:scaffold5_cov331-Pavlova_lutheri.AAC.40
MAGSQGETSAIFNAGQSCLVLECTSSIHLACRLLGLKQRHWQDGFAQPSPVQCQGISRAPGTPSASRRTCLATEMDRRCLPCT